MCHRQAHPGMEPCWVSNSAPKVTLCTCGLQRARARQQLCLFRRVGILQFWCPAPLACFCVSALAVRSPWSWVRDVAQGSGTLHLTEDSILSIWSLLVVLFPSALFMRDCHRREIIFNFYDLMQDVGILLSYRFSVTLVLISVPEFCNQSYPYRIILKICFWGSFSLT